jgi:hypothetical protein
MAAEKNGLRGTMATALLCLALGGGGGVGVNRVLPARPAREMTNLGERVRAMEMILEKLQAEVASRAVQQDRERIDWVHRTDTQEGVVRILSMTVGEIKENTSTLKGQMVTVQQDIKELLRRP